MVFLSCPCIKPKIDPEAQRIHDTIKRELQRSREFYRNEMKILLLGTGEAGKSTILKQIQMIHGKKFTEIERKQFAVQIRRNLLDAIQTLLGAMDDLRIAIAKQANIPLKQTIQLINSAEFVFDDDTSRMIHELWLDAGVQQVYERRREFILSDSAEFFLDKALLIGEDNFLPDDGCIMRMRVATTGIVEYPAQFQNVHLLFVDVGGQRSERRKWINAFDNVSCLFFVASLSEYDQLVSDPDPSKLERKNRMEESVSLFDTVLRLPHFRKCAIILFLNKMDLLDTKLPHCKLEEHFPDFSKLPETEGSEYSRAKKFIKCLYTEVFTGNRSGKDDKLYSHFTCATDRSCVERVYQSICDDILSRALRDYSLS